MECLEDTGLGVVVLDARAEPRWANRAATGLLGERAAELRAALLALRPVEGLEAFPAGDTPHERVMRGDALAVEVMRLARGEATHFVALQSRPVRDAGGALLGALLTVRDETVARAAAERARLQEHFAATRGLAVGLAHEVNGPLLTLTAHLDFVHKELEILQRSAGVDADEVLLARLPDVVERLSDSVREVREAVDRVRLSARDLRLLGQSSAGTRAVDMVRVLDAARRLAATQIQQRARSAHAYLRLPAVEASESEVCQIVVALLVNGARAVSEVNPEQAEVRLEGAEAQGGTEIVVRVQPALGLPPEADPADDGAPLSLTHCGLAAAHFGGRLTHELDDDVLRLRLFLPGARRGVGATSPALEVAGAPGLGRRGRVLVIDDEEAVGAVVRRILTRDNDVTTVTRADDGLVLLLQGARFDVILCDMMMPEMSGPDFYHALESSLSDLLETVVFVTGGAFTAKTREFLDHVPNSRLEKPFDPQVLATLIRDRVAANALRRPEAR